jgi:hypothetical protein
VTFGTEQQAKADAIRLATRLNEHYEVKSFKPLWHENLGWHSSVGSDNLRVWEPRRGHFHCLLGVEGCGMGIWKSGDGSNPITAIRRAIQNASASLTHYMNIVIGAAEQIGGSIDFEPESK